MNFHSRIRPAVTRELRAAVIGAGVFGSHHAKKYAGLAGVKLVAIADQSAEARLKAQNQFHTAVVADWRQLLGEVDIVSICSPAVTHAEIVRAFLNAGAHVLVEKPIATDLAEAEELIALAAEKNLVLTVGHQERFVFAHSGLLDFEDAPLKVECMRAGTWSGRGTDVSAVLDLMIHDIDLLHQLVPVEIAEVKAWGHTLKSKLRDDVTAQILFENGTKATLAVNRCADERSRWMRVTYPDGEIFIDFLTRKVTNTTKRPLRDFDLSDPLGASVGGFVQSVQSGSNALVLPEEAVRALETALMVDEAAAPSQAGRAASGLALSA